MADSGNIPDLLSLILPEVTGDCSKILSIVPVSGGDINYAWKVSTNNDRYFLKTNRAGLYPELFKCEAEALRMLASTRTVTVPGVLYASDDSDPPFLLMRYIVPGSARVGTHEEAGRKLAGLHRITSGCFGYSSDNYIGSLRQSNTLKPDFIEFFVYQRLMPLALQAVKSNLATARLIRSIENLSCRLKDIIPVEPPALLHGDLWSGNLMTDPKGCPVFIDPAVYYGHREADIAMTRLFGGFPESFYQAYHEAYPLEPGWQKRSDVFNLYPLLVHLNLFGAIYLEPLEQILKKV